MVTNGIFRRVGWGEFITCATGGHFGTCVSRTKAHGGVMWVRYRPEHDVKLLTHGPFVVVPFFLTMQSDRVFARL